MRDKAFSSEHRAAMIERELSASLATITAIHADAEYRATIATVADVMADALERGNMLLFAGNGGSAADSQHIAGEFVSRLNFDRPGLAAIALTVDSSVLTAVGNDYGFERVFARQIEALGREGDVLVAISTSGNSPNVIAAIEAARRKKLVVVGMTGRPGGKMRTMCDHCLCVPAKATPRIQEGHLVTYHLLCGLVEDMMFGAGRQTA